MDLACKALNEACRAEYLRLRSTRGQGGTAFTVSDGPTLVLWSGLLFAAYFAWRRLRRA